MSDHDTDHTPHYEIALRVQIRVCGGREAFERDGGKPVSYFNLESINEPPVSLAPLFEGTPAEQGAAREAALQAATVDLVERLMTMLTDLPGESEVIDGRITAERMARDDALAQMQRAVLDSPAMRN